MHPTSIIPPVHCFLFSSNLVTSPTLNKMALPFFSEPLAKREIRILTMFPGSWDAAIRCQLQKRSLDEEVLSYEALSYCWGDKNDKASILVDDISFHVRRNLRTALQHIREHNNPNSVALWIDSICIDQQNKQEKASQIPLMAEIYHRATRTISWLGEADNTSDHAMAAIREFGNWLETHEAAVFDGEHEDTPEDGSVETFADFIEWLGYPIRTINWWPIWDLSAESTGAGCGLSRNSMAVSHFDKPRGFSTVAARVSNDATFTRYQDSSS